MAPPPSETVRADLREASRFPCPHCDRVLKDQSGLYSHVKVKHGRKAAKPFRPEREREPSMADLVVAAIEARACGEAVDPVIAEMFDV